MEMLDGIPIDDLARVAEFGLDPRPLLEAGLKAWFLTAIRDGFFHGDVHAGNFMLLRDGRLGLIDWGIVGRLDADTHQFFRTVLRAGLGDESAWAAVGVRLTKEFGASMQEALGYDDEQMADYFRRMMEPILTQPFGQVSLAGLLAGPMQEVERQEAEAGNTAKKSFRDRWKMMRRFRNAGDQSTDVASFSLGSFLFQKQLLYFERYGKMFLSDMPLLGDAAFFHAALEAPPILSA